MKGRFHVAWSLLAVALLAGCPEGIEPVTPDDIATPGAVGAGCRPADHPDGPCDQEINGNFLLNAVCVMDVCLIDCSSGGDGMCQTAQPYLGCSPTAGNVCIPACVDGECGEGSSCFATENVCLPTGSFPSSPCRAADDPAGVCDQDLAGIEAADMICVQGSCAVDCSTGGADLCQQVNEGLTCSATAGNVCVFDCGSGQACPSGFACFESEGTCLPEGAFPGSPCRVTEPPCDSNVGGVEGANMVCTNNACVIDCSAGGQELCQGVDASLNCSATAGNLCLPGCVDGQCGEGFDCLTTENNCLPLGSFPGSECRPGENPCDQNVAGVEAADMVCLDNTCVIPCTGADTPLCQSVNPQLKCVQAAGEVCLLECGPQGECSDGFDCFANENACLPTGAFPGSPCRTDPNDPCDQDVGGNDAADMICVSNTCLVNCLDGGADLCSAIDPSLDCSSAAGNVCVPSCNADGTCDLGLACLDTENVCLPRGSFPGAPCRADAPRCDIDLFDDDDVDMACVGEVCVVDCRVGGDETCEKVNENLQCVEAAGSACLLKCATDGSCDEGFSCFADENACLPTGAFPGSPCRPDPPACDSDLGGNPDADMVCTSGACVVDCSTGGTALCEAVNSALTCSAAAGGGCVKKCLPDNTCADAGFSCFTQEGSCLPTGAFPSSPCRTDDPKCDTDVGGDPDFDLACLPVGGVEQCLFTCPELAGTGKTCADIDPSLTCAGPSFGNTCLPIGSFPGSPCRSDPDDQCDVDISGIEEADMACIQGTCVITCDATNDPCAAVDSSLACSVVAGGCVPTCGAAGECSDGFSCFTNENVCLPTGSFPGSPCNAGQCAQDLLGVEDIDMICSSDTCVVDCAGGGDFLCELVDPSLACSGAGGNVCVPACQAGQCPTGFSCFESENTCLPTGAFPGSPCAPGDVCADVGGVPMICGDPGLGANVCVPVCSGAGTALCQQIDGSLSCLPAASSGLPEDVCVTNGTFPESLCRDQEFNRCDLDLLGQSDLDMQCYAGTCQVDCSNAGATICGLYAAGLGLPGNAFACTDTGTKGSFCARAGCAVGQACPADYHCDPTGAGGAGVCLPYKPVHIVHTNDLHSHFDGIGPFDASNPSVRPGGYPQLATVIKGLQGAGNGRDAAVLTLDGGDFLMGSLFHILQGVVEFDFFKYLGYDAATLGNHELDFGPAGLAAYMANNIAASAVAPSADPVPILSANLNFDPVDTADDLLENFWDPDSSQSLDTHPLKRFHVVQKQGLTVGIFGLIGAEAVEITPTAAPLTFDGIVATSQAMVDLLRAPPHNCDVVVAVSHSGSSPPPFSNEDEVVAEQVTGLDVIVSGHTHEEVAPKIINGTWVMQAHEYGKLVGELQLGYVTRDYGPEANSMAADIQKYAATPITSALTPDPVLGAGGARDGYIAAINGVLSAAGLSYDAQLGNINTDFVKLDGQESNLGNLIADANRVIVSNVVAATAESDPITMSVEANGVIRDDLLVDPSNIPTPVTVADAFAAEPLGASASDQTNVGYPMVTFWITADEIKQVLEVAATLYYVRGDTFWLNTSGVNWRYDLSRPGFDRVTGLWIDPVGGTETCDEGSNLLDGATGAAKDGTTLYRVASNLYVAGFAELLQSLTGGALSVTPKDKQGNPASIFTRVVPDGLGGELRQWTTLVQWLTTVASMNGDVIVEPTSGRVREATSNPCP